MKRSVRLISTLLTLIMLLTALPMGALADTTDGNGVPGEVMPITDVTISAKCYATTLLMTVNGTYGTKTLSDEAVTVNQNTFGPFIKYGGRVYEFFGIFYNKELKSELTLADYGAHEVTACYVPHIHKYKMGYDRIYHWEACACGDTLYKERHVDPATDDDSICTCGYEFHHDADLVTLWLKNMVLETRFNKGTTEYNATIHTYKPVTSTEIKVRTNDALATVELPTDLTIQKGMNVFEVTVTAEDCKTTKTYTVYAFLPENVDGMQITSTKIGGVAQTVTAPKAACKKRVASVTLTEAIGQAMAAQAKQNESTQIILQPTFSKWANDTLTVTAPAAALKALAESKADFVIKTWQGDVTIPASELASIAGQGETIVLNIVFKDGPLKCTVTADGEAVENSNISVK